MSDIAIGGLGLGILIGLIGLRVPIAIALISFSFGGLWYMMGWDLAWGMLGVVPFKFSARWELSLVPMFLLLGFICYHTELTKGLFKTARILLERLPGGLGQAAVVGSAGFAAVSGSSVACSATMGRIAVPEMIKSRYDPGFATGIVAVAGTIGALIPPSIIMILFGVVAQESVEKLFLGGITAGLLTTLSYMALIAIRVKINPDLAPRTEEQTPRTEMRAALWDTAPLVIVILGIFTGLFSGLFTPTEAGAIGAALATIVAFVKGALTWKRVRLAAYETLMATSMLLFIAIGASLLTRFLALSGVTDAISGTLIESALPPLVLLLGLILTYLFLGMFLDPIGAMLLTLPIVLAVVAAYDVSMILFGVILTKLLEIGMITPPVGMNVFVIKSVVGELVTTQRIFAAVTWFIIADLLVLALLIAVPDIVLFLPNLKN